MNLPQNQNNHASKQHLKKRLSHEQVRLLEASFKAATKLEPEHKLKLSRELGVPPRKIAIWYQNKKARWKNHTLELGFSSLQLRLDAALAEKRQLEDEAENLRGELKRARDMLKWAQALSPPVPPLSSLCDDGGRLNDDVANGAAALPFGEVYGCLMLGGDSRDILF
ncbi:hypothetical protein ACS0TY_016850 [Phlomoides rotata]